MSKLLLFTGGIRSGKSAMAQRWAESESQQRLFIAPCRVTNDPEMSARIDKHKKQRGQGWDLIEEDLNPLVRAKIFLDQYKHTVVPVILFDSVSIWIANLLESGRTQEEIYKRVEELAQWLKWSKFAGAFVSAESGLGLVSMNSVGRMFQDTLGEVNQLLAKHCSNVIFVSCGLPLVLKGHLPQNLEK